MHTYIHTYTTNTSKPSFLFDLTFIYFAHNEYMSVLFCIHGFGHTNTRMRGHPQTQNRDGNHKQNSKANTNQTQETHSHTTHNKNVEINENMNIFQTH